MVVRRLARDARLSLARLPGLGGSLGGSNVPDAPAVAIRDLWPGDTGRGARLMKGELVFAGAVTPLQPGAPARNGHAPNGHASGGQVGSHWTDLGVPPLLRAHAQGFSWLRDLRALGTDGGRLRARALASEWLARPPNDPVARAPHVVASRVTAWLTHYDFFAASADDAFRQRLMTRLMTDARTLAANIPTSFHDHRALTCLKGLLACAVAMPEQSGFLTRTMRHIGPEIGRQILADGTHAERSPGAQLGALRELAEMRALMQIGQIAPPLALAAALDRMSPVLRALRHGDGGLALFNGSHEENPAQIDLVLAQSTRGRVVAAEMPDGGFIRVQAGRSLLLVDAGPPPPTGFDVTAHAGTLSFELSVGRERLIVNCGAGILPAWRDALRATAAHSTLVVADTSSSEFRQGAIVRRPANVTIDHRQANGAHWLDLSQDGYAPGFGAVHHRRIYVAEGGEDVRGEDMLVADKPVALALRFHLHPGVKVARDGVVGANAGPEQPEEEAGAVLLTLPSGSMWRLRADSGRLSIEEGVYLGGESPRQGSQVVITVTPDAASADGPPGEPPTPAGDAAASGSGEEQPVGRQTVRWAISRVES
ncbi:heparinase II/III family protein [Lichenicola sp.]|uniref:heparinase II/III family protein n=1 Tax=Lichenicola sp. TaxID=2804529 RepID=UPI003B001D49